MDRPGFKQLLDAAAVGDTIRIADAARLFRSVADVLALRPVLIRRGLHLKVASGLLSGIDLAADDPGTKMVVSVLAAVLEFQRDMISENTREGVAAAAASGKTLGRPNSLSEDQAAEVLKAYRDGTAVKAPARQYQVDPKTIRRVLDSAGARAVPDDLEKPSRPPQGLSDIEHQEEKAVAPERIVTIDVPGLLADHLRDSEDAEIREVLRDGQTIRRGQGFSVPLAVPLSTHRTVLHLCAALAGGPGVDSTPAERKAYRVYSDRIEGTAVAPSAKHGKSQAAPSPSMTAPDLSGQPVSTPVAVQPGNASRDEPAVRSRRMTKSRAEAVAAGARLVLADRATSSYDVVAENGTVLGHVAAAYSGARRTGWQGWAHGSPQGGATHRTRDLAGAAALASWIRIATAARR
ncbi:recombinase family protein [Streptomyces griseus]|uniref:recombinase family protein n=1 Tax=Streptomyces griseus TaxID=1911 RepID=UPI0020C7D837|nr:recombinase family protein [Streptomyces griseus]